MNHLGKENIIDMDVNGGKMGWSTGAEKEKGGNWGKVGLCTGTDKI